MAVIVLVAILISVTLVLLLRPRNRNDWASLLYFAAVLVLSLSFLVTALLHELINPDRILVEERPLVPFYTFSNPLTGGVVLMADQQGKTYYYYHWKNEEGKARVGAVPVGTNVKFVVAKESGKLRMYENKKNIWYFVFSRPVYEFTLPEEYDHIVVSR